MINIRRPMCVVGAVYVALTVAMMFITNRGAPTYGDLDKERVTVAGYVTGKEYRMSRNDKVPVVTLSEAVILEESQISVLEQFLSDSEKIPQQRLHRIWKENKEYLRRKDTVGIEGVLCYMDEAQFPEMGSLVIMRGSYRAMTHATNPGEFDGADYYRIMGQQGRVMECGLLVKSTTHDGFGERMYRIREYCSLLLDACYDSENASVMKAMLLGEKGTLDADIKELYQQNGIIHILAISGLHLSVIGMGCHASLKKIRLPEMVNIMSTIGLMYCYGTMTGMGVSMLRAYIMFALHLCAGLIGRTYDLLCAVTVAALVVLIRQPLYLQHSGFLFSFGAICGIGIFLPATKQNLFGRGKAEQAIFAGIAVSISTLPVYLNFYYEFPPYSVLLNLIVIPCMTLTLLCGLLSLTAAACFLPLGVAVSYPVAALLGFYKKCCDFCLALPDNRWGTGCPKLWQTVMFLLILVGLCVGNRWLPKLYFWQGVLCALLVLTVRLPYGLQITMVDVGQGDCIYLAEDSGMHMLIDGGSSDQSDVAEYQIMPFLKHEGASCLDAVVVTHPDSDHICGIRGLLEEAGTGGISIRALYLPDVGERGRTEEYCELEKTAEAADVPVRYIGAGDILQCGGVMLTCLHPEKGWNTTDTNAYSTVLYLTYGDFTALFTGDLEGEGERKVLDLIRTGQNSGKNVIGENASGQDSIGVEKPAADVNIHDITLLKVAHHGSGNSTGEDFLQAVNPKVALISAGRNNRYGHPHEELLDRLRNCGCMIYRTQESGAVTVRVRGGKVRVSGYLEE
ncbi:MAG: ComEC/Rec2 family competence protein [Lachnospiraceae bacterium]|nr:ComEC/Rec2 family competence protein [Lachnospiraceae bacterium]